VPCTCEHTSTCPLLSCQTDFHKIFCHYRQLEPHTFSFHKPVITTQWKHKLVWQEVAKCCNVTSSEHIQLLLEQSLSTMKDKEMATASDLYLPFSLMAVIIINHWNLKFCTDTDHKRYQQISYQMLL